MLEMKAIRVIHIADRGIKFIDSERERRIAELEAKRDAMGFWRKLWLDNDNRWAISFAGIWCDTTRERLTSISDAAMLAFEENGESATVSLNRKDADIISKYR